MFSGGFKNLPIWTALSKVLDMIAVRFRRKTNREGTITSYIFDDLKRLQSTTEDGISQINVLDAAGNLLSRVRQGADGSSIALERTGYDLAGRMVAQTNALSGITSISESYDGSGHLVRTSSYPDGGTRIETFYKDGNPMTLSGTAVRPLRWSYGLDLDGETDGGSQIYLPYSREWKESASGTDLGEWAQRFTDFAGRASRVRFSADTGDANPMTINYYNSKGQLNRSDDPDGIITLYQYNNRGELEYQAVDINQNGVIDFAGTDRITRTVLDVVNNAAYGTNVVRRQTYVWNTSSVNSGLLMATAETSTDGLRQWNTVWNNGVGAVTKSQTAYSGGNRFLTNTAPDSSKTVAVYSLGRLQSTQRLDSSGTQLGLVSYSYDPHGRVGTMADARNGTTFEAYNNADQQRGSTLSYLIFRTKGFDLKLSHFPIL
jgi:hypothetical protein